MSQLNKSKLLYVNISLISYILLYLSHIINNLYYKNTLNYINTKILILIYLYETFIAVFLKQSVLNRWKLNDYLIHHLTSSLFMIIIINFVDLTKYYSNMQFFAILINSNEIVALLENYNISKNPILISKFVSLYITTNLIYYENYESYIYIKSNYNSNIKYLGLLSIISSWYHIFIVIPYIIKYIKNSFV